MIFQEGLLYPENMVFRRLADHRWALPISVLLSSGPLDDEGTDETQRRQVSISLRSSRWSTR